jgi:hypothetical protein
MEKILENFSGLIGKVKVLNPQIGDKILFNKNFKASLLF